MSQPATSSRLTNSAVNIIGATTANNTNYGVTMIGVTGNSFDISALTTGNIITIGATGTGNVTIGNATSGTITFPGATTFTQAVNGGTFTGTSILGTAATTAFTIGSNLTTGSVTIGAQTANTVTIGANSIGATGTVNVGTGSANINIGCTAASAVVLGRTGGSVTLGPPLTLGAAPPAGSSGYGPHLGCVMNGAFIANDTAVTSGTTLTTATLSGVPPGIWILSFNAQVYPNGAVTTTNNLGVKYNISTIINTGGGSLLNVSSEGTNYVNPSAFPIFSGVTCLTITSTTTYYLNVTITFSGDIRVGTGNSFFRAVRIG